LRGFLFFKTFRRAVRSAAGTRRIKIATAIVSLSSSSREGLATATATATKTQKKNAARAAAAVRSEETDLFDRGKTILGENAGGLIKNLLKVKGGNIALARAAIETASTKQDPREYVAGCIQRVEAAGPNGWDPRL
jgi:uncharacterized membrane-anchored protein